VGGGGDLVLDVRTPASVLGQGEAGGLSQNEMAKL
jgi:hypothetical protein